MEYNIRKITKDDLLIIDDWWIGHKLTKPDRDLLPGQGLDGFIIEKTNAIAACYIYLTNSKIAYIDFLISDPKYKNNDRDDVIKTLITACVDIALNLGNKIVWATSENKGVINKCKENGFNVSEQKHSIIYKKK